MSWSDIDVTLRVTASIGIADHGKAADPANVMPIADKRLYLAKAAARNHIVANPSGETEHCGPEPVDRNLAPGRVLAGQRPAIRRLGAASSISDALLN